MNFLAVHSRTAFSLWRAAIWDGYNDDDYNNGYNDTYNNIDNDNDDISDQYCRNTGRI